jgi:hypothetical protein
VYLENEGSYNFQPYSLARSTGRTWLTMDAGDITMMVTGTSSSATFQWAKFKKAGDRLEGRTALYDTTEYR